MQSVETPDTGVDRAAATAASLSELRGRVDGALANYRQRLVDVQTQFGQHMYQATQQHGQELKELSDAAGAKDQEIGQLRLSLAEAESRLGPLRGELESARQRVQELEQGAGDESAQVQRLSNELAAARSEIIAAQQAPCDDCQSHRNELDEARASLAATHADLDQLREKNEEICRSLSGLEGQVKSQAEIDALLADAEKKFEIALADVDRLKQDNERLKGELALRPEPNEGQAEEIVSLKAERDGLADRVRELEESGGEHVGDSEEMEDLQRRFEMAVDEVHNLKAENEQLRAQSAASPPSCVPAEMPAGDDWEAQKARLLASLSGEDETNVTPERQQELVRIEETIANTDRVIAERDREIEELRQRLENPEQAADAEEQQAREAILDENEVIEEERARLEDLQQKLTEMLREAELEISVEKAKISREKAALEERLAQAESGRVPDTDGDASNKPKRRWLSALGMGEDDGEGQ